MAVNMVQIWLEDQLLRTHPVRHDKRRGARCLH